MRFSPHLKARAITLCFLIGFGAPTPASPAAESRNILATIVSSCLDINAPDYCKRCSAPRLESPCAQNRDCTATTEVWKETAEYVVIRDLKMCGCAPGFVHGLVIPRARITGIEDPKRPDTIWNIAWTAAGKRIAKEDAIALVVNPGGLRTQDQLHVHIVRLQSNARKRFDAAKSVNVRNLNEVWIAAAKKADDMKLQDYGVLVARNRDGSFLVLVNERSPEKLYTQGVCK